MPFYIIVANKCLLIDWKISCLKIVLKIYHFLLLFFILVIVANISVFRSKNIFDQRWSNNSQVIFLCLHNWFLHKFLEKHFNFKSIITLPKAAELIFWFLNILQMLVRGFFSQEKETERKRSFIFFAFKKIWFKFTNILFVINYFCILYILIHTNV